MHNGTVKPPAFLCVTIYTPYPAHYKRISDNLIKFCEPERLTVIIMNELFLTVKLSGAVILGFVSYLLGGWDAMLRSLVVLTGLDLLSGMSAAVVCGNISSRVAWTGFVRKIGTYVVVALAVQLDILLGTDMLRQMVVGFFITVEGISILENWGQCGLPLPKKLHEVLEQLKLGE